MLLRKKHIQFPHTETPPSRFVNPRGGAKELFRVLNQALLLPQDPDAPPPTKEQLETESSLSELKKLLEQIETKIQP